MEVGVRMLGFLMLILRWILKPFYYIWAWREAKLLPPIKSSFLTMSATQLAAKIRTGEIKSEDVVRSFITRIKEVNPLLNAVVEDCFSAALEEARKADELVASKSKTEDELKRDTPFLGVPYTVKESCKLKGLSFCVGTLPRAGVKADEDGEAVHLMRKSGAIPLAATTTPECCLSWETNNLVTGKTMNPYNRMTTSGGSSGGEGALLGAGASVIGVGSDIAGSIRIPSMYNGVFGHKPTPGYISLNGHHPNSKDVDFRKFLVIGPMARYSEDLKPMMKIMAGDRAAALKLDEKIDLRKVNVYYLEEAGFSLVALKVDNEIKQRQREAIKYLQNKFDMPVQKGNFKELEDSVEISLAVFFGMEGLPSVMQEIFGSKVLNNIPREMFRSLIGTSQHSIAALSFLNLVSVNGLVPKNKFSKYQKFAQTLSKKFEDALGDNGVFLYVTFPTPAHYHNLSYVKCAGVMYAMIFNVLGMPSTHVPLGLNKDGMPIGIQVVAAPHNDRLCFAVAEELEKGFGGWIPPPMTSA